MDLRSVHDLASTVRGRRLELGLSQAALATASGLSRKWVSEFERGKPAAELSALLAVLDALGLVLDVRVRGAVERCPDRRPGGTVDLDDHLAGYAAGTAHRSAHTGDEPR